MFASKSVRMPQLYSTHDVIRVYVKQLCSILKHSSDFELTHSATHSADCRNKEQRGSLNNLIFMMLDRLHTN